MMIYVKAIGGMILLSSMLYYALRLLSGRKRKVVGSIALLALMLPLMAGTVGLMGVDFTQNFTDELEVYDAVWKGFLQKGQAFINALTSPEKTTKQALTIVAMLVVAAANLVIVVTGVPTLMEDGAIDWSTLTDPEDFFAHCLTLYPVTALLSVLAWAVMVAVDIVLCIGAHWLLHGALPF